jgi:hypothetical protein
MTPSNTASLSDNAPLPVFDKVPAECLLDFGALVEALTHTGQDDALDFRAAEILPQCRAAPVCLVLCSMRVIPLPIARAC